MTVKRDVNKDCTSTGDEQVECGARAGLRKMRETQAQGFTTLEYGLSRDTPIRGIPCPIPNP